LPDTEISSVFSPRSGESQVTVVLPSVSPVKEPSVQVQRSVEQAAGAGEAGCAAQGGVRVGDERVGDGLVHLDGERMGEDGVVLVEEGHGFAGTAAFEQAAYVADEGALRIGPLLTRLGRALVRFRGSREVVLGEARVA